MIKFTEMLKLRTAGRENGMSLIDVVIYTLVSGIFSVIVFSIFITIFDTTTNLTNKAFATSRGQVVANTINLQLANSNAVKVFPMEDGAQVVKARVATEESDWKCETWVFGKNSSSENGIVYHKSSADEAIVPDDENWEGWAKIATNISPALAAPSEFFSSASASPINYGFHVEYDSAKSTFTNSILPSAVGTSTLKCFD